MQIEIHVASDEKRTGIGPGLWLITVRFTVGVDAPAGPYPSEAYIGFLGYTSSTDFNTNVTADPETSASNELFIFAKLAVVTVPDLIVYCTVSPGALGSAVASICAEKIG